MSHSRTKGQTGPRPSQSEPKMAVKRGRPMKHASDLRPSRRIRNQEMAQYQKELQARIKPPDKRAISILESLPVELIQHIFFLSLEINLPRASLILSRSLSNEAIYNALVCYAYFDDDGESPVETKSFLPAEYRQLTVVEKVNLQKGILKCRWCNLNQIKSCMPTLCRLVMIQSAYQERETELALVAQKLIAEDGQQPAISGWAQDIARLPEKYETEALEAHFMAKSESSPESSDLIIHDYYLPRIATWLSTAATGGQLMKLPDRAVSILATRHIPDWLLQGKPWTSEKVEFLQLLRQGYTFIQDDHYMNISQEALTNGMINAITERNLPALATLLELRGAFFRCTQSTKRLLTIPNHHTIPVKLFHLVSRQGSSAAELMTLLLREAIDCLPKDDDLLTRWAIMGRSDKIPVAEWLMKHMDGVHEYLLDSGTPLFINGMLAPRRRPGFYPFPERRFADELGYISGDAVVPTNICELFDHQEEHETGPSV